MFSRCFKVYRAFSISFISSNVGGFFGSWILKACIIVQEKKKSVVVLCSQNVKIGSLTYSHWCNDGKEMCKKRDKHAQLSVFCQSKPTAFLRFSLPSSSSLLELPHHGRVREKFYEVIIQMKRLPLQDFQMVLFVFFGLIRTWLIIIESGRRLTRSVEPSGL